MSEGGSRLERIAPPRVGPFREGTFRSPLHSVRVAGVLGIALGVAFTVCFLTGFLSHVIQYPPSFFEWPARPAWLYRVTQGIHVATGIASIPLLLAKLWTVYPRLWTWPPLRSVAHAVERVALLPLVGGSLFLLFTGVASIARWFPWSFSFPPAHYAAAWITIGALVVHVGAKATATRLALSSRSPELDTGAVAAERGWGGLSRRGFLGAALGGAAALWFATVGQTVRPLASISVLAPRDPRVGPQGLPVNKTASSAGVVDAATSDAWRLTVEGSVATPLTLSLGDLRSMPYREADLVIACVDGWSAAGRWRGVPIRDLLLLAGASPSSAVRIDSLQRRGAAYAASEIDLDQLADPDTMLAVELNGSPLHIDHGFPVRLIGPNRPGVQQTKWVAGVVVL
jgi:DMSO/TMAO reductase YedYZ molybdopterin-dependent catalytic subunit